MASNDIEGFVEDGQNRLLKASKEKIAEIEKRIRARYAEALATAGFMDRMKIEAAIRRELKAEVEKIAPPDALY